MQHPGIVFMRLLAPLPLAWVRAFGALVGWVLYALAVPRRRIVLANLGLCFPQLPLRERRRLAVQTFVCFAQAWLDRSWLWHGDPARVRQRLQLTGALDALRDGAPVVLFAPHFYGLDAGWTALTQQLPRAFTTIYTPQPKPAVDAWIQQGRQRFGQVRLFYRADGVKPIVSALRAGEPLYLLPDMNFGPQESIFVPFYGVPAATVPSLSRFARLARARVVPVITRMTPQGYTVEVHPAWPDVPTDDAEADTACMNRRLEQLIDTMPAQYYWVHKRFKTRPPGQPEVY
jgi:Kdo2-lipid IVA lauroyltransferase/acyltransferase